MSALKESQFISNISIREKMDKAGLTQRKIAEALNVDKHSVWRWITGRNMPRREVIKKIEEMTSNLITSQDFIKLSPPIRSNKLDVEH